MIQGAIEKYKKVQELNWNETEKLSGKTIKIKGFPRDKKVKIFWIMCICLLLPNILLLMTRLNHHSYDVEFESQTRWYFEDINREVKQLTGNGRVERVVCE